MARRSASSLIRTVEMGITTNSSAGVAPLGTRGLYYICRSGDFSWPTDSDGFGGGIVVTTCSLCVEPTTEPAVGTPGCARWVANGMLDTRSCDYTRHVCCLSDRAAVVSTRNADGGLVLW